MCFGQQLKWLRSVKLGSYLISLVCNASKQAWQLNDERFVLPLGSYLLVQVQYFTLDTGDKIFHVTCKPFCE